MNRSPEGSHKTKEQSKPNAHGVGSSIPKSEAAIQLKDQRPESVKQGKMQQLAENSPVQKKANTTGMPDQLKSGIEGLSGYSMNDVKVHYNSSKPAQLNAHAYAQGNSIHLGPGQEKHLPHEAWHVVQQKQGRVKATTQLKAGTPINDNEGLEKEADMMGNQAAQLGNKGKTSQLKKPPQVR